MKYALLLAAAGLLVVIGCRKQKVATAGTAVEPLVVTEEPARPQGTKQSDLRPVNVRPDYSWPGETDPFTILSTRTSGDTLMVEVQYGGGCRDHVFTMSSTGSYMKSLPPQMNLYLEHENNDDNCRALLTETLKFDVTPLRYSGSRELKLIINGDREKLVSYTW